MKHEVTNNGRWSFTVKYEQWRNDPYVRYGREGPNLGSTHLMVPINGKDKICVNGGHNYYHYHDHHDY